MIKKTMFTTAALISASALAQSGEVYGGRSGIKQTDVDAENQKNTCAMTSCQFSPA